MDRREPDSSMWAKVKIKPILFGGGQQKDLRSGTENVPGIAGLGLATKMIYNDLDMKSCS